MFVFLNNNSISDNVHAIDKSVSRMNKLMYLCHIFGAHQDLIVRHFLYKLSFLDENIQLHHERKKPDFCSRMSNVKFIFHKITKFE